MSSDDFLFNDDADDQDLLDACDMVEETASPDKGPTDQLPTDDDDDQDLLDASNMAEEASLSGEKIRTSPNKGPTDQLPTDDDDDQDLLDASNVAEEASLSGEKIRASECRLLTPHFDLFIQNRFSEFSGLASPPAPANRPGADHLSTLQKYFGHSGFKEMQWDIISNLVGSDGKAQAHDHCVVMATGYGKSLVYQFPPLYLGHGQTKTALVVSPLISLMEDQV